MIKGSTKYFLNLCKNLSLVFLVVIRSEGMDGISLALILDGFIEFKIFQLSHIKQLQQNIEFCVLVAMPQVIHWCLDHGAAVAANGDVVNDL